MFSETDKSEIIEIHNFIRNNLNRSLSNEKTILKYLMSNYSIKESEANLYIKIIKAEWV
jgi:hypothetical protein